MKGCVIIYSPLNAQIFLSPGASIQLMSLGRYQLFASLDNILAKLKRKNNCQCFWEKSIFFCVGKYALCSRHVYMHGLHIKLPIKKIQDFFHREV